MSTGAWVYRGLCAVGALGCDWRYSAAGTVLGVLLRLRQWVQWVMLYWVPVPPAVLELEYRAVGIDAQQQQHVCMGIPCTAGNAVSVKLIVCKGQPASRGLLNAGTPEGLSMPRVSAAHSGSLVVGTKQGGDNNIRAAASGFQSSVPLRMTPFPHHSTAQQHCACAALCIRPAPASTGALHTPHLVGIACTAKLLSCFHMSP